MESVASSGKMASISNFYLGKLQQKKGTYRVKIFPD